MSRRPCASSSTAIATARRRPWRKWDLRWKINLLIGEWKAAGGGDVLPDVRDRMRLRSAKKAGNPVRAIARH
ncbi:hypothetical protein ACVW04_006199 [Bradyrhizobium sp. LM2.3]